jgi:hypothetical protein
MTAPPVLRRSAASRCPWSSSCWSRCPLNCPSSRWGCSARHRALGRLLDRRSVPRRESGQPAKWPQAWPTRFESRSTTAPLNEQASLDGPITPVYKPWPQPGHFVFGRVRHDNVVSRETGMSLRSGALELQPGERSWFARFVVWQGAGLRPQTPPQAATAAAAARPRTTP